MALFALSSLSMSSFKVTVRAAWSEACLLVNSSNILSISSFE